MPILLFAYVKSGLFNVAAARMPAWREWMSDAQLKDVVTFVEAMSKMPPQTYLRWRAAGVCSQFKRTGSILGTATAHQSAPNTATAAVR
jgi:hypothetical protein